MMEKFPFGIHVCTQMGCPVCWEDTSLMMSGPKGPGYSTVYKPLLLTSVFMCT